MPLHSWGFSTSQYEAFYLTYIYIYILSVYLFISATFSSSVILLDLRYLSCSTSFPGLPALKMRHTPQNIPIPREHSSQTIRGVPGFRLHGRREPNNPTTDTVVFFSSSVRLFSTGQYNHGMKYMCQGSPRPLNLLSFYATFSAGS